MTSALATEGSVGRNMVRMEMPPRDDGVRRRAAIRVKKEKDEVTIARRRKQVRGPGLRRLQSR